MQMLKSIFVLIFFFFKAEDGIRYYKVTGVQTCALPIWPAGLGSGTSSTRGVPPIGLLSSDRKSTRLNSSHLVISYALFCLENIKTHLNSRHLVISYAVFCLKKKHIHDQ